MEELLNTLEIKLEQNMVQVTVMLNALKISNLFAVKPTARTGRTIKDTMEVAVLNLMFGRPTNLPMPTLLTSAQFQDIIDVKETIVVMGTRDKMETATKTDAT